MEQIIVKGIVLRAIDYGEKDKIVTILTEDRGKLTVILKGVKKASARMKFASQPFCYAEFTLTGKSELRTVIGAVEVESFFGIVHSYQRIIAGSAILEMTEQISNFGESNLILFNALKKALRVLTLDDFAPDLVLMRFALGVFKISGYEMNLKTCRNCGKLLSTDLAIFDVVSGEFNCIQCPVERFIQVSPRAVELMQKMVKVDFEDLAGVEILDEEAKEFRQIIRANFEIRFGVALKSLG